jgi:hypothetical protein
MHRIFVRNWGLSAASQEKLLRAKLQFASNPNCVDCGNVLQTSLGALLETCRRTGMPAQEAPAKRLLEAKGHACHGY